MHMVLLKGYLEWQPRMARVGGDLGHAMQSCLAHFPNQVTYAYGASERLLRMATADG
jgi:hypothetical protein